jgi:hypothetical protein
VGFIIYRVLSEFFYILFIVAMYQSSAVFSGWFRLNRKSRKIFDILSTKCIFFVFFFTFLFRAAATRQPPPPPPHPFRCPPVYMGHADKTAHLLMSVLIEMSNWCLRFACFTSSANRITFGASQCTGSIEVLFVSTGSSISCPVLHTARQNYE